MALMLVWFSRDFPMFLPWFCNDFPMCLPWCSHDCAIILQWFTHVFALILPWISSDFPVIFQWFFHVFSMILPCSKPKAIYLRLGPRLVFLDPEPWCLENVSLEAEDDHHHFMEMFPMFPMFSNFFPHELIHCPKLMSKDIQNISIYIYYNVCYHFENGKTQKTPSFHMNDFLPDMGISGVKATCHDGTVCETGSAVV